MAADSPADVPDDPSSYWMLAGMGRYDDAQ